MELFKKIFDLAQDQYGARSLGDDWTARVRRALRVHPAPRLVDADALAAQLGVSRHGLSRRLARQGVTLTSLLDEALYERAKHLLKRPGMTAAEVADALGYAELSSFFRAFRRWSGGKTPKNRGR